MSMDICRGLLIIRMSALGDVAMSVPVIYSLAKQYKDVTVYVLTDPFFARLFVNAPSNIVLVRYDKKSIGKGVTGIFRLLKMLHELPVDSVADFHNVLRSWIIDLFFILKGKKVAMVKKGRIVRKYNICRKIHQRNFVQRYEDVVGKLGFMPDLNFRSIFEDDTVQVHSHVGKRAIGIAPFARYTNKTYPVEKMKTVVDMLLMRDYEVYLFGNGNNEADVLNEWQNDNMNIHSLAGSLPLEKELSVMSGMKLMITMDSANHHIASLAGVPVLSIWGGTTPACGFMAYNQPEDNALFLNLPCQPCCIAGRHRCKIGSMKCLYEISPDMIVCKVEQMMNII